MFKFQRKNILLRESSDNTVLDEMKYFLYNASHKILFGCQLSFSTYNQNPDKITQYQVPIPSDKVIK